MTTSLPDDQTPLLHDSSPLAPPAAAPTAGASNNDKTHSDLDLVKRMVSDAWNSLSWLERGSLVFGTVPPMILFVTFTYVRGSLQRRLRGIHQKPLHYDMERIADNVYQIPYCVPNDGCNATIILDSSSSSSSSPPGASAAQPRGEPPRDLMIVSAPPCTDDAARYCEATLGGRVAVLVVPSTAHDAHAKAWKERFPEAAEHVAAKVGCPPADVETYETPEGKRLLRRFGVVEYVDVSPYSRFPDAHLVSAQVCYSKIWVQPVLSLLTISSSASTTILSTYISCHSFLLHRLSRRRLRQTLSNNGRLCLGLVVSWDLCRKTNLGGRPAF